MPAKKTAARPETPPAKDISPAVVTPRRITRTRGKAEDVIPGETPHDRKRRMRAVKFKAAEEAAKKLGRPSAYRNDYHPQSLLAYFNVPESTEKTVKLRTRDGSEYEETVDVPAKFPTLAGWCCQEGIHRQTAYDWAAEHPDFSYAMKAMKEHMERILVDNGLMGRYDRTFAVFVAKNTIGYRDQQVVEHDVKPGGELASLLSNMRGSTIKPSAEEDGE